MFKYLVDWCLSLYQKPTRAQQAGRNVPPQWCLVGNIVTSRTVGPGGGEHRSGTKHFSGGTKVWCFPRQWGDANERTLVIGRHRRSKQWITIVIPTDCVTNWRAQVVYDPDVLQRLCGSPFPGKAGVVATNWTSEEHVRKELAFVTERQSRSD